LIKNKKILITGIYGFLGKHLAIKLHDNNEIIGINLPNKSKNLQKELDNITIIEGDVSENNTLEKINSDIDLILHFGSPTSVILFKQDPTRHFNNTVNGMKNILEFAKKNSIKKLIYPSSASVYAKNSPPHTENIIPKPSNPYGSAKVECENLAHSYNDTVNSIGLRIFAVYGPGEETKQNLSSVINLFLGDVKNSRKPVIFGDGTQTRDFIYVDDAISAIINSTELPQQGIINVGSGISTSFNLVIEKIGNIVEKKIKPVYVKKESNYVEKLQADTKLMESTLKIHPLSIELGISKFAKYLNII
jgi:UDP-glucose 4-epimerase